jgi:hypothetical protein
MTTTKFTSAADTAGLAFRFVLIVGIANLFADMTYEGPAASPDLSGFAGCQRDHGWFSSGIWRANGLRTSPCLGLPCRSLHQVKAIKDVYAELARRIDLGVVDLDFVCLGRGKLHRAPLSKQMVQLLERKV